MPSYTRLRTKTVAVRPMRISGSPPSSAMTLLLTSALRFPLSLSPSGLMFAVVLACALSQVEFPTTTTAAAAAASKPAWFETEADKLIVLCSILLSICHVFSPAADMRKVVAGLPRSWKRGVRQHLNDCWVLLALAHAAAAAFLLPDLVLWTPRPILALALAASAVPVVKEALAMMGEAADTCSATQMSTKMRTTTRGGSRYPRSPRSPRSSLRHPTQTLTGLWAFCAYLAYCATKLHPVVFGGGGGGGGGGGETSAPPLAELDLNSAALVVALGSLVFACFGEMFIVWQQVVGGNTYLYAVFSFVLLYGYAWAACVLSLGGGGEADDSSEITKGAHRDPGRMAINLHDHFFTTGFDSRCSGSNAHLHSACYYAI